MHDHDMDVMLLVPFEDPSGVVMDPVARQILGARFFGLAMEAFHEFQARVGFPLSLIHEKYRPLFGGEPFRVPKQRSLSAVTLSTHLERAGLRWYTLDPGSMPLGYWRKRLKELAHLNPKVVGVSTTFVVSGVWLAALLAIVRQALPRAKIVLGGYHYASDAKGFLSFDADVFCVGEGELRFVELVRALRDERPLDGIPGLYLPQPSGGLRYTGRAEPLNLSALPAVDWSLSNRIDPPVDPENDPIEMGVETQRGCVFKCGFCTYRTLTSPNLMTPEIAAERILALGKTRHGAINIVDATATYPHERWRNVLQILISRGGSRLPIWCYARVSDIDEETAALMAQAGVRQVFIGQESGDQRILNIMRKGTHVSLVKPAIDALLRNDINIMLSMIHGYPGETLESAEATRRMLVTANDGYEANHLPVLIYLVAPFAASDMAAVAHDERLDFTQNNHYIRYQSGQFKSETWATECARTLIATSRSARAPVNFLFFFKDNIATHGIAVGAHPHRQQLFQWLKQLERGTGLFLAHQLEGQKPSQEELDAVRRELEGFYEERRRRGSVFSALAQKGAYLGIRRMVREWRAEESQGPGAMTRLAAAGLALTATGRLGAALDALREGTLVHPKAPHVAHGEVDGSLAEMAKITIEEGLNNGKQRLKMLDSNGQVVALKKTPETTPLT